MIKHMIKQVSHTDKDIVFNQAHKKVQPKTREIKSNILSLEAYDLYIFLPLWQQVTKKFENA